MRVSDLQSLRLSQGDSRMAPERGFSLHPDRLSFGELLFLILMSLETNFSDRSADGASSPENKFPLSSDSIKLETCKGESFFALVRPGAVSGLVSAMAESSKEGVFLTETEPESSSGGGQVSDEGKLLLSLVNLYLQFIQEALGLEESNFTDTVSSKQVNLRYLFPHEVLEDLLRDIRLSLLGRLEVSPHLSDTFSTDIVNSESATLQSVQFPHQKADSQGDHLSFNSSTKPNSQTETILLSQNESHLLRETSQPKQDMSPVWFKESLAGNDNHRVALMKLGALLDGIGEEFRRFLFKPLFRPSKDSVDAKVSAEIIGDTALPGSNNENEVKTIEERVINFQEKFAELPSHLREEFVRQLKTLRIEIEERGGKFIEETLSQRVHLPEQGLFTYAKTFQQIAEGSTWLSSENQMTYRVSLEEVTRFVREFFVREFSTELHPGGERRAYVQLEPPELGKMELEVRVFDGEVEVRVKVEKAEVLTQLQQELTQLKSQFEELGLRFRDLQLFLGFSGEEKSFAEERNRGNERGVLRVREIHSPEGEAPRLNHRGRLYRIV